MSRVGAERRKAANETGLARSWASPKPAKRHTYRYVTTQIIGGLSSSRISMWLLAMKPRTRKAVEVAKRRDTYPKKLHIDSRD